MDSRGLLCGNVPGRMLAALLVATVLDVQSTVVRAEPRPAKAPLASQAEIESALNRMATVRPFARSLMWEIPKLLDSKIAAAFTADCAAADLAIADGLPRVSLRAENQCAGGKIWLKGRRVTDGFLLAITYHSPDDKALCRPELVRQILTNVLSPDLRAQAEAAQVLFDTPRLRVIGTSDYEDRNEPADACFGPTDRLFLRQAPDHDDSLLVADSFVALCSSSVVDGRTVESGAAQIHIGLSGLFQSYVRRYATSRLTKELGDRVVVLPKGDIPAALVDASKLAWQLPVKRGTDCRNAIYAAHRVAAGSVSPWFLDEANRKDKWLPLGIEYLKRLESLQAALTTCASNHELAFFANVYSAVLLARTGKRDQARQSLVKASQELDAIGIVPGAVGDRILGVEAYHPEMDEVLDFARIYSADLLSELRCPKGWPHLVRARELHTKRFGRILTSKESPIPAESVRTEARLAYDACGETDSNIAVSAGALLIYYDALAGSLDRARSDLEAVTAVIEKNDEFKTRASSGLEVACVRHLKDTLADAAKTMEKMQATGMSEADAKAIATTSIKNEKKSGCPEHFPGSYVPSTFYPPFTAAEEREWKLVRAKDERERSAQRAKHRAWLKTPEGKAWARPRCKTGCENTWVQCASTGGRTPIDCVLDKSAAGCPRTCAKDYSLCRAQCESSGVSSLIYDQSIFDEN